MSKHLDSRLLTSGDVDEVLAGGLVDLDVAVADVVLVPLQRHLAVHRVLEEHQGLAIAATLGAQTQSHATPTENQKILSTLCYKDQGGPIRGQN